MFGQSYLAASAEGIGYGVIQACSPVNDTPIPFRPDSPAEVVFRCKRKEGTVLYLPTKASCENTVALGDFGKWMIKHIDSWFSWVRLLGVGIERMEEIVLVTGTHRTRSWTNVAFPGDQEDGLVSFGVNVATRGEVVTVNWKFSHEYTRGAVLNYGPHGEVRQCLSLRWPVNPQLPLNFIHSRTCQKTNVYLYEGFASLVGSSSFYGDLKQQLDPVQTQRTMNASQT